MPSDIVYEDESVVAFKDINPKAPIHVLIVPKKHIISVASEGSEEVVRELISVVKKIAQKQDLKGYKLVFNVGREGGQVIDHLHLHLLAGRVAEIP